MSLARPGAGRRRDSGVPAGTHTYSVVATAGSWSSTAATASTTVPACSTNLLSNPGFETGTLSGWTCSPHNSVDSTTVRTGSWSMKAVNTAGDRARCSQTVAITPGTTYTLEAWRLGAGGVGYLLAGSESFFGGSSSSYQQIGPPAFTAGTATSITVYLETTSASGAVGHFDDVTLIPS